MTTSRRTFLFAAGITAGATQQGSGATSSVVRAVVAADGSGDFATVQRAVDHVLDQPPRKVDRVILEVRPGATTNASRYRGVYLV